MDFRYETAKSLIKIELYEEHRVFNSNSQQNSLGSNSQQNFFGNEVSWRWRFATRTTMLLRFQSLKNKYAVAGARLDTNARSTDINFFRKIGRSAEGSVMVQSISQDGLAGGRSYDEKRLSVGVKWEF